ncbi:MAG: arginine--tRNA ligase [Actinobacteria bacterium]|nr:arginine--tRNA ligase [Actinomycetota bacterium]MCB8996546.1 arginine--tRNA ligase [Actinomycetota bacterium]MCB9415365.1 arginine--tRNA ligase [Actinomycetota bacterium]HRY08562.1 arginine--tRNA ligase [Candidatus Nanopelagicales bacterium]
MTPEALAAAISDALAEVPDVPSDGVEVKVERPKNRDHGDYATNVALVLAKRAGMPPRDLATKIVAALAGNPGIAALDIAGPGFINITLAADAAGEIARTIVEQGSTYGTIDALFGTAVNLEFISANPTGPLHLGHTRWAAVGDAMARVLAAAGAEVTREFYVNDRGVQMDKFGLSLEASALGEQVPEGGYQGEYIHELAAQIVADDPAIVDLPEGERMVAFREAGYALQLQQQKDVLDNFRTHFDVWYSERSLHETGAVDRGMAKLREQGHVFEHEGAVWLRTTDFDDDKDRVLIKADGELTYFASDTAYYVDKRDRGFDICIYLLGADHHGYVNRLRAVAACAGDNPDYNIEILIGQLVKMFKGGEEVRLSKRAGAIVTLEDLVDEVGVDAARYTLIRYPADSPLTMDLDLLVQRTNENPVYYVQYAHARISSVLRNAADLGIDWRALDFDPGLLTHERESALLGVLAEFPRIIATAAELREPHRVSRYLEEVATAYHKFYDSCRVLPRADEELEPLHIARLWLCAAARQVVANGLELCGVSAPERM